ncbi:hypothetical protein LSUE1_G004792 [Lachnellula suecica]|uniref:Uncharacterized protein n=1 Tax=Lachnellula suecica TaxID=602035 RepID=A0A8T9CCH6_9HELO|nr:hypothetical protein LSUE1_G004792 [Lachnellula suecica]
MGENSGSPVVNPSSAPPRQPLLPRTISPPTTQLKQIRRKASFVFRSDSDEDVASPHSSIFEALYHSGGSGDENYNSIALNTIPRSDASIKGQKNDENAQNGQTPPPPKTPLDVEFRYGKGTALDTITEQKSYNTLSTLARSKSVDELPTFPFLHHRDSLMVAKSPRTKKSFSLDDIDLVKQSYHDACANIERATAISWSIFEEYAKPKDPLHSPLERPPTPPGMPSWTAGQNISSVPRPSVPQQNRFQRFFGLPPFGIRVSSREPRSSSHGTIRSVSLPVARRVPRFRPPRSVYAPIESHPFNNAPVAEVQLNASELKRQRRLNQQVRFTPSATARDSEMNALRDAIESTRESAIHPTASMEAIPSQPQIPTHAACPHRRGRRDTLNSLNNNTCSGVIDFAKPRHVSLVNSATHITPERKAKLTDTHCHEFY